MRSVLYLYNGSSRKEVLERVSKEHLPSAYFGGFLELRELNGLSVNFVDRDTALSPAWRFIGRRAPFLSACRLFVQYRLYTYDVIVSSANLDLLLLHSLLRPRSATRWILMNVNFSTLLRKGTRMRRWLYAASLKKADRIVCLSRSQQRVLEQVGVEDDRLVFIPLGADAALLHRSGHEKGYILSAGRDTDRDYATLIEAVGESYPLHIVASPRNLKSIQVPSATTVAYDIPRLDLIALYEDATLVVVSSVAEGEGVGSDCSGQTVVLEAMALGKTVIATHRDWMNDYLTDGEDVLIVPPHGVSALREVIDRCMRDAALRARIGAKARMTIRDGLTYNYFVERLNTLIQDRLA